MRTTGVDGVDGGVERNRSSGATVARCTSAGVHEQTTTWVGQRSTVARDAGGCDLLISVFINPF